MSALMDALGFVGDTLGRPGQAMRGLLAGRPDQLMRLVPGAETMGLVGEGDATSGRDLLQQYGVMDKDDSWGNWGAGLATEVATDPLTLFGAGRGLMRALGGAKPRPSGVSGLMGQRRKFDVMEVDPHMGEISKVRGGAGGGATLADMDALQASAGNYIDDAASAAERGGMALGNYDPVNNVATLATDAPLRTARHEVVHGMVNNAAQSGDYSGLPFLAKVAARARPAEFAPGARSGLAAALDELAAHTLENRGAWGQLKGAAKFLFNPVGSGTTPNRQLYADYFAGISPATAQAYKALGHLPTGAALGAGAGGAYLAGNAIMGE